MLEVLGLDDALLASTTFSDALEIWADITPSYVAGLNTVTTFRTLVRNKSNDTTIRQVNVDVPGGYSSASVAGTAFSSGTWAPTTPATGFDFAFALTSGSALATTTGWARIDITTTTPSSNSAADWHFRACANVGCGPGPPGGNATRADDNQAIVLVDATPPSNRYTADFRDGSNVVTTPSLRNGSSTALTLRITSSAGNDNSTKYTAIALPRCWGTPTGVTQTQTAGDPYDPPIVRDGFIILPRGGLDAIGNFMTVQLTVTPTACADGSVDVVPSVTSNQLDDASTQNQVVGISGNFPTATMDSTPPEVTINQAAGQNDPTKTSPINFTVVFNESVSGFTSSDVSLSGTASATTAAVSGSGTTYNVAVSGMTSDGTVIATVPAGSNSPSTAGAQDAAGNGNNASTSTDNTVTYDTTGPVTSNTAVSPTPTNAAPTVTATETDALRNVAAAEYFIDDASCTNGTGTAMSASDGSFNSGTENVSATLTNAQFSALGEGTHTIYVHGKDNVEAGNWGACQSATFFKDTVTPSSSATSPQYSTSNTFTVSYTASDAAASCGLDTVELWADPARRREASSWSPPTARRLRQRQLQLHRHRR